MNILSIVAVLNLRIPPSDVAYLLGENDYVCFLDSSLCQSKYSRFSYIAWDPKFVIKSFGYKNEFINPNKNIKYYSYQHPLFFLKQTFRRYIYGNSDSEGKNNRESSIKTLLISEYKIREYTDSFNNINSATDNKICNFDFTRKKSSFKNGNLACSYRLPDFRGGFIGYISYDLKNYIEDLTQSAIDDLGIPIFYFAYFDKLISYSHDDSRWYFIRNYIVKESGENIFKNSAILDTASTNYIDLNFLEEDCVENDVEDDSLMEKIYIEIEKFIKSLKTSGCGNIGNFGNVGNNVGNIESSIKQGIIEKYATKNISNTKLHSNFTRKNYLNAVSRAKKYIHNGDIYQVNLSQRFECQLPVKAIDLYYILREKNPAPFSAYINFPEVKIGSSSPERFLFKKNDIIETRPIKGTRPRGKSKFEDDSYIQELKSSIKDKAELNMIVDLERNDLGKFCYYGSIKVREHAVIEKYAKVFHSVSTVMGRVKKGIDFADIIKATFPGGSITGAPKIRAMEIIDELEPTVRSIYTGSIGYIGIDFTMDLNIVIRTFIIKGNKFYYSVGGGIVEDSVAEEEYKETLDKGIALQETLSFFESKNLRKLSKELSEKF